jgi:predicted enzyme related to lactoylglutathione lyase
MINGGEGGLWDTSKMGGDKWAIFYVLVDDVNEAVKQAEVRGARIAIPIVSSPVIEFAHLIDKDGNRFGVWKPKP